MDEYIEWYACRQGSNVIYKLPEIPKTTIYAESPILNKIGYERRNIQTFISPDKLWPQWSPPLMINCIMRKYHPEFLRILSMHKIPERSHMKEIIITYSEREIHISLFGKEIYEKFGDNFIWKRLIRNDENIFSSIPRPAELQKIYGIENCTENECIITANNLGIN